MIYDIMKEYMIALESKVAHWALGNARGQKGASTMDGTNTTVEFRVIVSCIEGTHNLTWRLGARMNY